MKGKLEFHYDTILQWVAALIFIFLLFFISVLWMMYVFCWCF